MKKNPLYWIGIRESELEDTDALFEGSITIFGSGKNQNYAFDKEYCFRYDYNEDIDLLNVFINEKAEMLLELNPDIRFMLYYPIDIAILSPKVSAKTLYVNDLKIIEFLDDKIKTRLWLSEMVPLPPFTLMEGKDIDCEHLKDIFPGFKKFVVQSDYSCGGTGTWLLSSDNSSDIMNRISAHEQYILLPYLKHSVSVNVHLVIYEQEILQMPASVQIIVIRSYSLTYQGSDFTMYNYLPKHIQNKVEKYANIIGKQLQYSGYRGVCGIDFIATKDEVFFSEINARFQSSTVLINKAMQSCGMKMSLQELHIDSFENEQCTKNLPLFKVKYSLYGYSYDPETFERARYLYECAKNSSEIISCHTDHIDWNMKLEKNTYLFKIVFDTTITSVGAEFETLLQPNLILNNHIFDPDHYKDQLLELKTMLLSHGIRISQQALKRLNETGGVNHEEFEAIDLVIESDIYINVPYQTKFSSLSPFGIELANNDEFLLTYFERKLAPVCIRRANNLDSRISQHGFAYDDFIYLGNDRLRIFHRVGCYFKAIGKGCGFCDIEKNENILPLEDIIEALDVYIGNENVKHFLIGGGSDPMNSDFEKIIQIAKYLKLKFNKPINVMSLPPQNLEILSDLKTAGITEVTFNLEIYDRKLAQKYMPGKGSISLNTYDNAFKKAVQLWGKTGNVRTVFIVGLESTHSLLEGVEHVCAMGVSPILSLLKGIQGTPMEYFLPPTDQEVLEIYHKVQNICSRYEIAQGPACRCCEDNTLKISL